MVWPWTSVKGAIVASSLRGERLVAAKDVKGGRLMDGFQEAAVAGLDETRTCGFAETVAPTGVYCTLGSVVGPAKLDWGDG